jgi:arylsulfatase
MTGLATALPTEGDRTMADAPTDVLVAGYQTVDEATRDFDGLVALVKEKKVAVEGAILVTHSTDGSVNVQQTGDHLGRKGAGWGGGVGLAVGLAAPPLLASVAVGAAAGGVIGRFVTTGSRTRFTTGSARTCRPARPASSSCSTTSTGSRSNGRCRARR